jgi:hypothetical protein
LHRRPSNEDRYCDDGHYCMHLLLPRGTYSMLIFAVLEGVRGSCQSRGK